MFTAPALQVIADAIRGNLKKDDEDLANDIADFCESNIKATCTACGGDGLLDDNVTACAVCAGTGQAPTFGALIPELTQRNNTIQTKSKAKLKKK